MLNAGAGTGGQQEQKTENHPVQTDPSFEQVFGLIKEFGFLLSLGDQVIFASSSETTWWFSGLVDPLELAPARPGPHPPLQVQPAILSAIPAPALGANL